MTFVTPNSELCPLMTARYRRCPSLSAGPGARFRASTQGVDRTDHIGVSSCMSTLEVFELSRRAPAVVDD